MRFVGKYSAAAAILAPSVLVSGEGGAASNPTFLALPRHVLDVATPAFSVFGADSQDVDKVTVSVPVEEEWSRSRERRFSTLTAAKARGQISREDLVEWKRLRDLRREKKNPVSADEIIFQHRRRQLESRLLQQLSEYVEFLEAPRRSKA